MPVGAGHIRVELAIRHRLKPHLLVVTAENLREVEGKREMMIGDQWGPIPEGYDVVVEGTQVGVEAMDFVVGLIAVSISPVAGLNGQPVGRSRWLTDLYTEDAATFAQGPQPPQAAST
jgi:hypothetical protein